VRGARAVHKTFVEDPRLARVRPYVVWIPMLDEDEGKEVPHASTNVRLSPQYFDGQMRLGTAVARALGLPPVYDIYMFFGPEAEWTTTAPVPEVVIGQLGGAIVATPGALPALADQSKLLPELDGRLVVVAASQGAAFPALLEQVSLAFAARHPSPAQR